MVWRRPIAFSRVIIYNGGVSSYGARCTNCGKRIGAHVRICPQCGFEQPRHQQRIRCHHCGRRVPANAVACPSCGQDPRGFYLHRGTVLGVIFIGALAIIAFAVLNPTMFAGAFSQISGENTFTANQRTIQGTTTPRTVVTVIVVANEPPTANAIPTQPTFTRSPTARSGETPTLVPSPELKVTPTRTATLQKPTLRATRTLTPLPIATVVATSAPRITLLAPADGEKITGSHKAIALAFQPLDALGANEWYRVRVDFLNRSGEPETWCGWTQETSLQFPPEYFDDSSPVARSFKWQVSVARAAASQPMNCDAQATIISSPSATWTFYWY